MTPRCAHRLVRVSVRECSTLAARTFRNLLFTTACIPSIKSRMREGPPAVSTPYFSTDCTVLHRAVLHRAVLHCTAFIMNTAWHAV